MDETKQYCYKYPRPAVTTDTVVFGFDKGELKVLLIARKNPPFAGSWAFPGGFMEMNEDADTCACRELEEETGLKGVRLEQLYTFTAVNRDPRYRVVSIAYYAFVRLPDCSLKAGDDAIKVRWFPVSQIPALAFDHRFILQLALDRLKVKIRFQPIGMELLPSKFTVTDLRCLYESILQRTIDGRNFRNRMLRTGLLTDASGSEGEETHQSMRYYSFNKETYKAFLAQGFYLKI